MRFAFLILGPRFEPERDRAAILDGTAQIVGVPTVERRRPGRPSGCAGKA